MTTNTQLDILGHLLNQEEPQTIRGIARALGKSYPLVYNAVQELVKQEIIITKRAPPATLITLNRYSPLQVLLEAEKKRSYLFLNKFRGFHVLLEDILRSSKSIYFSLLVFGSYAKGKQTPQSDLDLLIIVPTKGDIPKMEDALMYIPTKTKKHFIIVEEDDFISMLSKANQFNVGNEAKKHHLILYGAEQYYELVKRARQ